MNALRRITCSIQRQLFPAWESEVGALSDKERQFVRIVAAAEVERFMTPYQWQLLGRKPEDRLPVAKAFIAKSVWNFTTTRALLDYLENCPSLRRLCGWDSAWEIPSESTFSRAFAAFATGALPQKIHEAMVCKHLGPKLVGHISRDSTAITGREKPVKKEPKAPKAQKKRGRPRKDEPPRIKEPTRLMLQGGRTLAENLADLPQVCDAGCKRNSQGYQETWRGYKLHLDCADGDIPVSAILSSASLHDSQAAIPLAQMTAARIRNLYDLMDSAYDAPQIEAFSQQLDHVPLIDPNPRRGEKKRELDPAAKRRFGERSTVERVNSNLLENFGGTFVRVRGSVKVMCHLMFGVLALTAAQLFHLLE
ncbi:MAG: transposase [Planctomycetota bacterium]